MFISSVKIDLADGLELANAPEMSVSTREFSLYSILKKTFVEHANNIETANVTSPIGKLAVYLMYNALNAFLEDQKDSSVDKKALQQAITTAHGHLPISSLRNLGCPKEVLIKSTSSKYVRDHLPKLRTFNRDYVKDDTSIPKVERDLFTLAIRTLKEDVSDSSIKSIEKLAWTINTELGTKVTNILHPNANSGESNKAGLRSGSIDSIYANIKTLVKQLGGTGLTLHPDLVVKARNSTKLLTIYKEYNKSRRMAKDAFETSLKAFITSKGGDPVDVGVAEKEMRKRGFELLYMPTNSMGFEGKIGIKSGTLALFTSGGTYIAGSVPPGSKVTMNKKYVEGEDNAYVMIVTAPNAVTKGNRIYSGKHKNVASDTKFEKADQVSKMIPKLLGIWARDCKDKEPKRKMHGTAAMLLYLTGARVGSNAKGMASKKGVEGYGVLNMRAKHVKVTPTSIIFTYPGKKGMEQKHIIRLKDNVRKLIAKNIEEMVDGKHKDDMLFTLPSLTGNREVSIGFSTFSSYLKTMGFTQGAHKMRHVRGTQLCELLLSKYQFKFTKTMNTLTKKQKAADDYMKDKILSKVADLLGHKSNSGGVTKPAWRTSIGSYVNPAVVNNWYKKYKLDIPKWIPKKLDV